MMYLLAAIGLTHGDNSTVQFYIKTITQITNRLIRFFRITFFADCTCILQYLHHTITKIND